MGVTAHLHPQVLHAQHLTKAFCPEKIGIPFKHGYHVLVVHLRIYPFLLAPYTAAVGPPGGAHPAVKEFFPLISGTFPQPVHIMNHFKKFTAFFASVYYFIKWIFFVASSNTPENRPVAVTHALLLIQNPQP